jgi:hypothetical protein
MSSLRARAFSELLNFSRSTTGAYCGADGVLASAAVDVPRIAYDPITLACRGLLIEPTRTNYLLRSQEFDNASWTKTRSSVTANADIAPDGTTTADKLVEDTTVNDSHYVSQSYTKTSTTEVQPYSASVWVKATGRTQIRLQVQGTSGAANSAHATFDLSAGTVGAVLVNGQFDNGQARVEAWPRGWHRCILDFRVNNDGQAAVTLLALLVSSGTVTYNGDGTSGVYVWGAQLEKGFYATSYIPTTTAAVARERDVCTLKTLAPWFQEAEGTLLVEYVIDWTRASGDTSSRYVLQIDDGSTADRHIIYLNSGNRRALTVTGGVSQTVGPSVGAATAVVVHRQAYAWDTDDISAVATGSAVSTDSSAEIPVGLTTARLGAATSAGAEFGGYLRKVRFYPRNMTDAELLALVA